MVAHARLRSRSTSAYDAANVTSAAASRSKLTGRLAALTAAA